MGRAREVFSNVVSDEQQIAALREEILGTGSNTMRARIAGFFVVGLVTILLPALRVPLSPTLHCAVFFRGGFAWLFPPSLYLIRRGVTISRRLARVAPAEHSQVLDPLIPEGRFPGRGIDLLLEPPRRQPAFPVRLRPPSFPAVGVTRQAPASLSCASSQLSPSRRLSCRYPTFSRLRRH
jgi:hypothetical protein